MEVVSAPGDYEELIECQAVAPDLFERGLCLPSGTAMTEADVRRVVDVVRRVAGRS